MGSVSIWHWVVFIILVEVILILYAIPAARILNKAGFSRWWTIPFFIPLLNLVPLWVFAFTRWPATGQK